MPENWLPQAAERRCRCIRPGSESVGLWLVLVAVLFACAPTGGASRGDTEISPFLEDALVSGRVLQNSTACEVDAACYLRIQFADTSIVALYGTGERPAPACEISRDVSNVAFGVSADEIVAVVISECDSHGYYLRQLALVTSSASAQP